MEALLKWMKSPEAQKIADAAENRAWDKFQQQFPNADRSKFTDDVNFAKNHTASAEILLKKDLAYRQACLVLISDIELTNEDCARFG